MRTMEKTVHFGRGSRTEKLLSDTPPRSRSRVQRVSRLMALAIRYEELLRTGVVQSLTELAKLGHVSKTQMGHIMNLLHLAPNIQERLLFLPIIERGADIVLLRDFQRIARQANWKTQRRLVAVSAILDIQASR